MLSFVSVIMLSIFHHHVWYNCNIAYCHNYLMIMLIGFDAGTRKLNYIYTRNVILIAFSMQSAGLAHAKKPLDYVVTRHMVIPYLYMCKEWCVVKFLWNEAFAGDKVWWRFCFHTIPITQPLTKFKPPRSLNSTKIYIM